MAMVDGAGGASGQVCAQCGASFPAWSMFCSQCGAQTAESRLGGPVARQSYAAAATPGPHVEGRWRSRSSAHSIWSIVWTVCSFLLCFLFWFPAFSQARRARRLGEPAAEAATIISTVGLILWLLLAIVSVALAFSGGGTTAGPPPPG